MSWWQTAKVGDRVVAVKPAERHFAVSNEIFHRARAALSPGRVLTIAAIEIHPTDPPVYFVFAEPAIAIRADHFRPIDPARTERGMATLRGLLATTGPWGAPRAPEQAAP